MRVIRLASTCLALMACVGDSPNNTPDASPSDAATPDVVQADTGSPDAGLATVTIGPGTPTVLQGASLDVTVTFARNGVTGPIALTASGAQTGTTITVAPIGDGTLTTQMKITAAANAVLGAVPITLKAPNVADFSFKLVVAGPSGSLDPSFDADGIVLDPSVGTGAFNAAVVQSDDKIVVCGSDALPSGKWIVRRYGADGSPDTAFNTAAASILPSTGTARAVTIDPKTGRIVIVGNVTGPQLAIVRLNANGTPDQSFASTGLATTQTFEFGSGVQGNAVAVRSDSSLVVAAVRGTGPVGLVIHYLADGTRDMGFFFEASDGTLTGITLLPQDAIFATGTNVTGGTSPLAVRLLASGAPDLNFAPGGVKNYLTTSAKFCSATSAARTTGGDVVMHGVDSTGPFACEVRITTAGAFTWKNAAGSPVSQQVGGVTAGPADGTYAVGSVNGTYDSTAYVRRRVAGGGIDGTFGAGGEAKFEDPVTPDIYRLQFLGATTTSDGRVVVVGRRTGSSSGPLLYRLWP